ncbi:MAG: serine hydrolase domain-containing protein [Pseudomonadota bacterium]
MVQSIFEDFGKPGEPGVSVLVMEKGHVRHQFHKGLADVGSDLMIEDDGVFNIGSISKQFTVFGILLLRDEGKLSLSDDVRTFIPELPDYSSTITLEHLARHTSGLSSQQYTGLMGPWTQTDERTHTQMLDLIRRQPALMFEPGTEFSYSNAGTALLAEVISRVSGMPFQRFMKERVYAPLGMEHTFNRAEPAQIITNEVHSYYREDGILKKAINPTGIQGYSNVYSTTSDLAKWAANLKMGKLGGLQTVQDLMSVTKLPNGRMIEHRMGLYATPYRGFEQFQHTGSHRGYTSYLGWFPDHDLTIIILSNIEGIDVFASAYSIADLYLPEGTGPLEVSDGVTGQAGALVDLSEDQMKAYEGTFWSDDLGDTRAIALAEGQLRYVRSQDSFSPLVPLGGDRFVFEDAVPPAYVAISEDGMVFEDSNGTVRFDRVRRQPNALADMASLAGLYVSDSISATYRLSVCGGEIWATNAVQDLLRFSPVARDIYRSNGWFFRSMRVLRDEAGGIFGFDAGNVGASGIRFIKVTSPYLQPPRYDECQTIKPNARG